MKTRISQFQVFVPNETRLRFLRLETPRRQRVGIYILSLFFCFGLYSCQPAFAITDAEGVQCIMGEARNQPYLCQVATGEALRNRGTTKGVFGCKVAVIESQAVWDKARKAWKESKTSNLVKGAEHWESTDFKRPAWSYGMTETAHYGKHIFYKK